MIALILEDTNEKLERILQLYGDDLAGRTIIVARSVTTAKQFVRLMPEELILFVDHDLGYGETGTSFLDWVLQEKKHWLSEVVVTSLGLKAPKLMCQLCADAKIPVRRM